MVLIKDTSRIKASYFPQSCLSLDWFRITQLSANRKAGLWDRRSATSQYGPQTRRPASPPHLLQPWLQVHPMHGQILAAGPKNDLKERLNWWKQLYVRVFGGWLLPEVRTCRPEWLSSDLLSDPVETALSTTLCWNSNCIWKGCTEPS